MKNDLKIIELVSKRLKICDDIGLIKVLLHLPIHQKLAESASRRSFEEFFASRQMERFERKLIRTVMKMLIAASKQRQKINRR